MRTQSILLVTAIAVSASRADAGILYVASFGLDAIFRYDADLGYPLPPIRPGYPPGLFVGTDATSLNSPYHIAIGPNGDVFVGSGSNGSDRGTGVYRFNKSTGALMQIIGADTIKIPGGFAFGPDGLLYVNSYLKHTIQRFNPDSGQYLGDFAMLPYGSETGIVFGPDGNLYVTNGFSVERFNGATGVYLGLFTFGHNMQNVYEPTFGPDGDLYVSDQYDFDIVRFNGLTGEFKSVFVDGQYPFNPAAGMAFGPQGDLFTTSSVIGNTPATDGLDRFDGRTGKYLGGFIGTGVAHGTFISSGIAFDIAPKVPEPSTLGLTATAGIALLLVRRKLPGAQIDKSRGACSSAS